MSTSKHIDTICVVISLLALLITALFMNGEALGISMIEDGDAGDGQFTANDLNADWDTASATRITLTGDGGSVKGNGAYIYDGDVHIAYAGQYVLSGELANGSVIVDATNSDKIWILLDGVSLHCDDGAALLVEQAEKVFLTLGSGRSNSVSSGGSYAAEAVSAGIDGAIYSRDDLTINGGGSLSVTAGYKHAIVCNDDLVITGGNIEITAAQDGIHANDSARFTDAAITINAGDDGITVSNDEETGYVYIESGSIRIPACYEGVEAVDITIAGGTLDVRPTDDGINANGRGSNSVLRVTGGDITIINETGRDADGLDSNGDIYISGGNLFISVNGNGGSCALDYGSENGGVCKISGGAVLAAGGSSMAEGFDSSSEQCFIMYNTSTAAAGEVVTLKNGSGTVLLSEAIPCSFSSVVISTPELQMGETCTISIGDTEAEVTVDNSCSSNGFGMGGMFGGGMRQDGMSGGRGGKMDQSFDAQTGSTPEVSGEDTARVEMRGGKMHGNGGDAQQGEFAPGGFQGGGPDGGEPPQSPDGEGVPDLPGDMGAPFDGSQMSGDDPQNGEQLPEQGQAVMGGGNRHGEDQSMQWGQRQDWIQDGAAAETPAVSPEAWILVGVSALFLLAGIWIAIKVKQQ